jgi:DNA repair exonuclease SbcCD ATPase subunit
MSRDQLRDAWTSAKSKKDTLDNDIDDREKLLLKGLAKCPNCGKKTSVSYTNAPLLADKNKISKLKTERTSCLEKHDTLEEQIKRDSKTRDTLHDSWTSLKVKAKLLEEEVVKHEKLLKQGKTTCPTCGQSISAKKFKTQLQTDRAEVSALKTQTKQAEDKFDTADAAISDLEKQRNDWLEKAKDVKTKIDAQESLLKQGFTKCDCGQTINGGKLKRQLQTDTESLKTLKTQTTQAKEKYDKAARAVSELEEKNREARTQAKTMKDSGDAIARYLKEQKRIAEKLESKISEIRGSLDTLGLQQLDPQDSAFERSLATIIPLDVDALEKKKDEFKKRAKLLREKTELHKGLTEKNEQAKDKLKTLKLRIQRAILARHLSEGFEQAIEDRRKDQLKRIEQLALQYYKGMTDQHTYTAITIDPENYRVFVHPKELTDRIPATRTGGGHQTLISIAIRLALLQELAFRPLLILDEPTYGVDDDNLPQLAQQLGQASKQLSQTIIVTHHGICEENATNILKIIVGQDGASHIQREGMDKSFLREGKSTPS